LQVSGSALAKVTKLTWHLLTLGSGALGRLNAEAAEQLGDLGLSQVWSVLHISASASAQALCAQVMATRGGGHGTGPPEEPSTEDISRVTHDTLRPWRYGPLGMV
jgi:hypothetical protein